jgi:membrane protein DedA with SNARE-associated domain
MVAGALGAATGDQLYFYLFRGRVDSWLARFRPIAARREAIVTRVRQHRWLMIIALRFAPGLRIAIAAACAFASVPALLFSTLNLMSAFAWAALLLTLITRVGPNALRYAGLRGIWGGGCPAT